MPKKAEDEQTKTKTTTKWRLKELPTVEELTKAVDANILSAEEAHDILVAVEEQPTDDVKALKSEINFLRELVEKLSTKTTIQTVPIKVERYISYPWWASYGTIWVNSPANIGTAHYTMTAGAFNGTSAVNYSAGNTTTSLNSDGSVTLGRLK